MRAIVALLAALILSACATKPAPIIARCPTPTLADRPLFPVLPSNASDGETIQACAVALKSCISHADYLQEILERGRG